MIHVHSKVWKALTQLRTREIDHKTDFFNIKKGTCINLRHVILVEKASMASTSEASRGYRVLCRSLELKKNENLMKGRENIAGKESFEGTLCPQGFGVERVPGIMLAFVGV